MSYKILKTYGSTLASLKIITEELISNSDLSKFNKVLNPKLLSMCGIWNILFEQPELSYK